MTRLVVTTAADAVAAELRTSILAGRPAPGEPLREEALAARYEVARHTVRAALRTLAGERLVLIEPYRGARVAHLDADQLKALFELRTALEVEAARLLAVRTRGAAVPGGSAASAAVPQIAAPPIAAAAAELERLCREDIPDRAAVDAAHLALHHALVAAAGSPRITQAHAALAAEQRLALLQSRAALPVGRMADHHRELLQELHREGPDALRRHLEEGRNMSVDPLPRRPGIRTGGPSRSVRGTGGGDPVPDP